MRIRPSVHRSSGFTLVELTIVLVLIASVAEIAVALSLIPVLASIGVGPGSELSAFAGRIPPAAWLALFAVARQVRFEIAGAVVIPILLQHADRMFLRLEFVVGEHARRARSPVRSYRSSEDRMKPVFCV